MTATTTIKDQIIDQAQALIQTRGYNGFSFRDIANEIGIKSSSIHYYYPSKTELAVAATSKYRSDFMHVASKLQNNKKKATTILKNYAELFQQTLKRKQKICLVGMLASEFNSVAPEVRAEVKAFFVEQHQLLTNIIKLGQTNDEIRPELTASDIAKTYLSALEGAMMLARTGKDSSDILLVSRQMISMIKT